MRVRVRVGMGMGMSGVVMLAVTVGSAFVGRQHISKDGIGNHLLDELCVSDISHSSIRPLLLVH